MAPGFTLDTTIGTLEIGVIVSSLLLGVLMLQVYMYYSRFSSDLLIIKLAVAFVCLCELGHMTCISHVVYNLSVTNYGNIQSLQEPPLTWGISLFFYSPIAPIVHTFFATRVYRFSKKRHIPAVIITIAGLVFIGSFIGALQSTRMTHQHLLFIKQWSWLLTVVTCLRLVNDVLITTTLITYLYLQRKSAQFAGTLRILDKLMLWTLQTGMVTALTNIIRMSCFFTMKKNWVWFSIVFFESKVFANSFLATLNSRPALRAMKDGVVYIDTDYGGTTHRPLQSGNIAIELTSTTINDASDQRAMSQPDLKDPHMAEKMT